MLKTASGKIIVKVKASWHGEVAFHEKYAEEALLRNEPLVIQLHGGGIMTIKAADMKAVGLHIGEKVFGDRFTDGQYHLAYLPWKADSHPQPLF